MDLNTFKQQPLLGIMRGIPKKAVKPLADAIVSSGLLTVEITMNTPGAPSLISDMVKSANGKLTIGAGTVLTVDELKSAVDAGATFIVSPVIIEDVIDYCVKKNIPVFPGALTPNEIYRAWNMGAAMVKVFPVKFFGPTYLKEIKGPFNDIELLACGGINPQTINDYFTNGASAAAFGGSVFTKESITSGDYLTIESKIKDLLINLPK